MKFSDYFLPSDLKNLYDFYTNSTEINQEWRDHYANLITKHFTAPLIDFLTEYRKTNGLLTIENSEGHNSFFGNSWNAFANFEETKSDREKIAGSFRKFVGLSVIRLKNEAWSEENFQTKYNNLINTFTTGDFEFYDLTDVRCTCQECAQDFLMNINEWKPSYFVWGKTPQGKRTDDLVKPDSCLTSDVLEVEVNFPSGELLIADWFRIPEFTNTVRYTEDDQYLDKSINHAKGRIFSTTRFAEKYNFISVSVDNNCPSIFKNNDLITVGTTRYDNKKDTYTKPPKDFEVVGSVCTDLWATTIIDKEQLIQILTPELGDKSADTVDEYLKQHEVTTVQVTPGNYILQFHGNHEDFNKNLKDDQIKKIDKVLILSQSKVKPKNDKKKKM